MKARFIQAIVVTAIFLGFVAARRVRAQTRGPSTSQERARAVKIAHALEADPLAKDAGEVRMWVVKWIVEIPDITVDGCSEYFGKMPDSPRGHSMEIKQQMIISSAAFIIEHPDKAKDEQAAALAGLLSSVKVYQLILKQEPASRWPEMDKLVRLRDQGKLDDFVADTRRQCSQDEEEPDPNTMRAQAQ